MEHAPTDFTRLTLRIPAALARQLDQARQRTTENLQTRLSFNQFLERALRLGLQHNEI